jgi:hypothetical protein
MHISFQSMDGLGAISDGTPVCLALRRALLATAFVFTPARGARDIAELIQLMSRPVIDPT